MDLLIFTTWWSDQRLSRRAGGRRLSDGYRRLRQRRGLKAKRRQSHDKSERRQEQIFKIHGGSRARITSAIRHLLHIGYRSSTAADAEDPHEKINRLQRACRTRMV